MLTLLVVWAMCARYTASVSLRQSSPTDIHEGWSHSVNIPQVENSISKGLAESSTSVMVTEAIVLAAENLDGYFVQKTYSDSTCNVWNVARSMPLNYCTTITSSNYSRMSATSNAAITVSFYSDSKCVTTPKSSKIIALGGCSGNYRAEYSSTSAPQSTRPFAKLTEYGSATCSLAGSGTDMYYVTNLCLDTIKTYLVTDGSTASMKQYSMDKCAGNVLKTTQFTSGVCLNATILTLLGATSSSDTSGYDSGYGSSGYKSCFAGSETLYVESRGATLISDIRVGDRVLAADAAGLTLYSDVVFVPHGTNEDNALFVHITTANDRDIKMTESHILPSGACNAASSLPLVYAKHVKVGDCVMTVSGMERVSAVETVKGQGLYTIVTKDEYVVVNGIIASPFAYNHMMASMYYNMHRFFYTSAPALLRSPLIQATNEALGAVIPFFGYSF